jgi:hypothetical protein
MIWSIFASSNGCWDTSRIEWFGRLQLDISSFTGKIVQVSNGFILSDLPLHLFSETIPLGRTTYRPKITDL